MRERPGQLWHCAFLFGFFAFHGERSGHDRGARRWGLLNAICALGDISRRPVAYSGRWTVNVGDGGIVGGVFWSRLHGRAVTQPTHFHSQKHEYMYIHSHKTARAPTPRTPRPTNACCVRVCVPPRRKPRFEWFDYEGVLSNLCVSQNGQEG